MLPVLRGAAFYAAPNEPQRHTRELRIGGIHAHTTQPPPLLCEDQEWPHLTQHERGEYTGDGAHSRRERPGCRTETPAALPLRVLLMLEPSFYSVFCDPLMTEHEA